MFFELSNNVLINLDYVQYIDGRIIQLGDGLEIVAPVGDIDKIRGEIQAYNRIKAKMIPPQKNPVKPGGVINE